MDAEDAGVCLECARIFEEMKQWGDAAALYEKAAHGGGMGEDA